MKYRLYKNIENDVPIYLDLTLHFAPFKKLKLDFPSHDYHFVVGDFSYNMDDHIFECYEDQYCEDSWKLIRPDLSRWEDCGWKRL